MVIAIIVDVVRVCGKVMLLTCLDYQDETMTWIVFVPMYVFLTIIPLFDIKFAFASDL